MKKITHKKLGFFITQSIEPYNDTQAYLHTSRRARKGLEKLLVKAESHRLLHPLREFSSLFTLELQNLTWWVSVLFMVGSACFVAGSVMSLYFEDFFPLLSINLTFFIGSLFFTAAAYGQYLEAINSDITNEAHLSAEKSKWLWWAWRPKNLGFMSSTSQLVGTFLFNINTFNCFYTGLTNLQQDVLIWIPNIMGSILFLVASFFAWLEIYHDNHVKAFRSVTWWIIWINILGSVLFQRSAFRSFVYLDSGELVNGTIALNATMYGAICFFIAAYLLIVEMHEPENTTSC